MSIKRLYKIVWKDKFDCGVAGEGKPMSYDLCIQWQQWANRNYPNINHEIVLTKETSSND